MRLWILSVTGDGHNVGKLLEVMVGTELLVLVRETLHTVSECLGHSTWCPGCNTIAALEEDCKEHICDCIREEYRIQWNLQ